LTLPPDFPPDLAEGLREAVRVRDHLRNARELIEQLECRGVTAGPLGR
jgi:hypothetical protein